MYLLKQNPQKGPATKSQLPCICRIVIDRCGICYKVDLVYGEDLARLTNDLKNLLPDKDD